MSVLRLLTAELTAESSCLDDDSVVFSEIRYKPDSTVLFFVRPPYLTYLEPNPTSWTDLSPPTHTHLFLEFTVKRVYSAVFVALVISLVFAHLGCVCVLRPQLYSQNI